MKNTNEKISAKENKAVELTDEELAKVAGGQFFPEGINSDYNSSIYDSGPCSERGYSAVSNSCLYPRCSKLCDSGVVCSCQDGPQRGIIPSPCME